MKIKQLTVSVACARALMLAACSPKGDAAKTDPATATSVTLQAQPDLATDVDALPRLAGDSAAIQAINTDLTARDAVVRQNACEGEQGGGGLDRGVSEPMTGPGFVSFWVSENSFCSNAAHPSSEQTALTYDLSTGALVDWVAAVPGLHLVKGDTTDMPPTYVPTVSSAEILPSTASGCWPRRTTPSSYRSAATCGRPNRWPTRTSRCGSMLRMAACPSAPTCPRHTGLRRTV